MNKYSKGLSFYVSIGHNKGISLIKDGPSCRLNLFWLSICFGIFDLEKLIEILLEDVRDAENSIGKIEALNKEANLKAEKYQEKLLQSEELLNNLRRRVEIMSEQVDSLNDEITDLNDANDENEKLKEQIEILKKTILDFEIKVKEYKSKIDYMEKHCICDNTSSSSSFSSSSSSSSSFSS